MNHFRLPTIKLAETAQQDGLRPMQLAKVGNFNSDSYGVFSLTLSDFEKMITNFNNNVRGVVPALDYGHDNEGIAAGWIKKLYIKNDTELWGDVELTKRATLALNDKEYAYLSIEFDQNYKTNEEPVKYYGPVLLGAALTNRPFIKDMKSAVQLSEGVKMQEKELMEKNEELQAKLTEMEAKLADKEGYEKKMLEEAGLESIEDLMEMIMKMKSNETSLAEKEEEVKTLSEKLKETSEKLTLSEKEKTFNLMLSEGKVCMAQKDSFIKGDMVEFAKNASAMNLSESGHGGDKVTIKGKEEAEQKIDEMAKKLSEEKRISYGDAVSRIRKENPELVKKLSE